jgi:hypothetical protein
VADSANTAELLSALWPVFTAIVFGFAYGIYVWANTRRDVAQALRDSEAASVAALKYAAEIAGLQLAIHREMSALQGRIMALETRQADILQALLYIKDNMLLKHRNRSNRSED